MKCAYAAKWHGWEMFCYESLIFFFSSYSSFLLSAWHHFIIISRIIQTNMHHDRTRKFELNICMTIHKDNLLHGM